MWSSVEVGFFFCVSCFRPLPSAFIVRMATAAAVSFVIGPNARSNAILAPERVYVGELSPRQLPAHRGLSRRTAAPSVSAL